MRRRTNMAIAESIATTLFTTGLSGQVADRLVLMHEPDGQPARNLGGWCRRAVRDVIVKALDEASKSPPRRRRRQKASKRHD